MLLENFFEMAFWGRGDRHLEADRRSTAGDLWPQPPTTAEGAHPVYKPRDWSGSGKVQHLGPGGWNIAWQIYNSSNNIALQRGGIEERTRQTPTS